MDLDALREALDDGLFGESDIGPDLPPRPKTIVVVGAKADLIERAVRAVLDSEEKWWCETHDAEGVPLPWGWEADECWRCIYTDVDPNAGLCRMVRRRLLAEEKL